MENIIISEERDGKNFGAFMGIELVPGALVGVRGKFYEFAVFDDSYSDKAEEYDKQFPYMQKLKLPGQCAVKNGEILDMKMYALVKDYEN